MSRPTRSHAPLGVHAAALILLVIAALVITALPASAATRMCGGKPVTILGTAGDDEIRGTAGDDVIAARGGHDTVHGLGGHDTICGGRGRDTLEGGAGNDALNGSYGRDSLFGQDGSDRLLGGRKTDLLDGGDGDDVLRAGGDYYGNSLKGQAGNDTIYGGPGSDESDGGPGDDIVHDQQGHASYVTTGEGNDTIFGSMYCSVNNCLTDAVGLLTVVGCVSTSQEPVTVDMAAGTYDTPSGAGTFVGSFGEIRGSRCNDTILGSAAEEDFRTGGGSDSINGGGGGDRVYVEDEPARSLSTTVDMDSGPTVVVLLRTSSAPLHLDLNGDGDDWLSVHTIHDTRLDLSAGTLTSDSLTGTIHGLWAARLSGPFNSYDNALEHTLIGDDGPNSLEISHESIGNSVIDGRGGNDTIVAAQGSDVIRGGGGDDEIEGGPGADEIWGEAGTDTIDGGISRIYDDPPGAPYRGPDICAGEHLANCEDIRTDTNMGAE